jgi:hypothetical protein
LEVVDPVVDEDENGWEEVEEVEEVEVLSTEEELRVDSSSLSCLWSISLIFLILK